MNGVLELLPALSSGLCKAHCGNVALPTGELCADCCEEVAVTVTVRGVPSPPWSAQCVEEFAPTAVDEEQT